MHAVRSPSCRIEPLEPRRLLSANLHDSETCGCGQAPAQSGDIQPLTQDSQTQDLLVEAQSTPVYNTAWFTDAELTQWNAMSVAEIRAWLTSRNSFLRQPVQDSDGVWFDPPVVIAEAAATYQINPKVIMATLQKEQSAITRTTRPSNSVMEFLAGCRTRSTARDQIMCSAERFRFYHDDLIARGTTISGWRVGVAKMTQDNVSVTPATRAVAGQFTYTPYAGTQWGGTTGAGGVYLFYNIWHNSFGFVDSTRPTATTNASSISTQGAATHTFTVTFSDNANLRVSDILSNSTVIRVTGPNGFNQLAQYVSINSATDGTVRTATYRINAPGGAWDRSNNGTYTISVQEAKIGDYGGNYVTAGAKGSFNVSIPALAVTQHNFNFLTGPQSLVYQFNDNVGASILQGGALELTNLTTGQQVPAGNIAVTYNASTNAATFTFPGYPGGILPNANYRATLVGANVKDAYNNALNGNHVARFFFLNGDADRSGTVNIVDFNLLAANFGKTGRNFSQGDFNGDGIVNIVDFNLLAANFGRSVDTTTQIEATPSTSLQLSQQSDPADTPTQPLAPASSTLVRQLSTPSAFSSTPIEEEQEDPLENLI